MAPRWRVVTVAAVVALGLGLATTLAIVLVSVKRAKVSTQTIGLTLDTPAGARWSVKAVGGRCRTSLNVSAKFEAPLARKGGQAVPPEVLAALPYRTWRRAVRGDPLPVGATGCFWNPQAYGWPLRAMSGGFYNYSRGGHSTTWLNTGWRRLDMIPIGPIWGGLLVDSVLYGAPWLALMLAIVWGVRRSRRRAGCVRCGYDTGGLATGAPCPECGTPIGMGADQPAAKQAQA
jgi:hypothetical protein